MVDPATSSGIGIGFNVLTRFLGYVLSKVKGKKLKSKLAVSLERPIKKAIKSTDALYFAIYRLTGATMIGNILQPTFPSESAQELVDDFRNSYYQFIKSFKELIKYLEAHLDEFRKILPDEDILILEATIQIFKSTPPDWNFMLEHGSIRKRIIKEMKNPKNFSKELNDKLQKEFSENPDFASMMETLNQGGLGQQQIIGEAIMRVTSELLLERLENK